ncbi:hypothetical protein CupriaWKF_27985 [Cupriavidus sp. WKF15]|uniref:hypothetical protein n=1 Tax=Cupriavidus sp. WKF15 TaxID=3032282 RepID=UPI0023E17729|nr:hypothetical protein [Cupriavidus sp. WKF15]WER48614.1 hypothetical protein CupriaWKF_27985 [Cupriavidus sp. WKF15]
MQTSEKSRVSNHVKIVVTEGKVTLEDLHKALDEAIRVMVPKGGCNCGLTGFDLSFLRGDPELTQLAQIPNVQGGLVTRE